MSIQTILGANGVIARELSRHLPAYTDRIRQVSRTPRRMHPTDDLLSADLLDAKATTDAVAGCDGEGPSRFGPVAHLDAAFPWQRCDGEGERLSRRCARRPFSARA